MRPAKLMSLQIDFFTLSEYIEALVGERVLFISNRDLNEKPFLYGEDYYISTFMLESKKKRIPVDLAVLEKNKVKINGQDTTPTIDKDLESYTVLLIHNISPFHVLSSKIRYRPKIIMPVYFLSNRSSSLLDNSKWIIAPFLWQPMINEYLVPSSILAQGLRRNAVIRHISVVPPVYSCPYCNPADNLEKKELLKTHLPETANVVYIGQMLSERVDLSKITEALGHNHANKKYRLTIYTMSQVKEQIYCENSIRIAIIRKRLSAKEKCEILRESHIFIAPAKGTTMEPSISVIEAEHHGNLVLRLRKNWN
ncbi:MAG TPA: hypothetical protein VMS94_02230 [Acidobacteriota bacterium]|nr:hypothetical protein [Acidobacteriota bacterium]